MPTLTFNWRQYTPHDTTPYTYTGAAGLAPALWITRVVWRVAGAGGAGALIAKNPGVYIIENNANSPIYAGMADDIRERFDGRSDALHELNFVAANLANYSVWTSSVVSSPKTYIGKVEIAEQWLVRFLYLRDAQPANAPRRLQNISLTGTFLAPVGGLHIRFKAGPVAPPAYLNDPAAHGHVAVPAGGGLAAFGYDYAANANVLP